MGLQVAADGGLSGKDLMSAPLIFFTQDMLSSFEHFTSRITMVEYSWNLACKTFVLEIDNTFRHKK
jgi:hypothetical protein